MAVLLVLIGASWLGAFAGEPDVQTIINRSAVAMTADWAAAPDYDYCEEDRDEHGTKTYSVTMIEGSPYFELVATNDRPLSPADARAEQGKLEAAIASRRAETPAARASRIAQYRRSLERNRNLTEQMLEAFTFSLAGPTEIDGREAYVLEASPREGYQPPNTEAAVLTGMRGTLWIDVQTFHWIKATASVQHPVSIWGFIARIEPGTVFQLENTPVSADIWQPRRFLMRSRARILWLFPHDTEEDDTFFDYRPVGTPADGPAGPAPCVR